MRLPTYIFYISYSNCYAIKENRTFSECWVYWSVRENDEKSAQWAWKTIWSKEPLTRCFAPWVGESDVCTTAIVVSHHTHGMAQLSQRIVCRISNEEMMSKEYLINEAHQLDHQTTILNKLDCVRIRCREEEEAERETHKKKSKPSSIHIQIGWAHQPLPLHTSLFNNYLYLVQSSAETNNKNIKLIRPCPSCSRDATIWLLMMMAQEIIVIILFRKKNHRRDLILFSVIRLKQYKCS